MILTQPTMAYDAQIRAYRADYLAVCNPAEGAGSVLRFSRTED